jgi:hypothetical protein
MVNLDVPVRGAVFRNGLVHAWKQRFKKLNWKEDDLFRRSTAVGSETRVGLPEGF